MAIEELPEVEEYVREFFDTLDYDGSGEITSDELRQIDINVIYTVVKLIDLCD